MRQSILKKKWVVLALCMLLVITLAACQNNTPAPETGGDTGSTTTDSGDTKPADTGGADIIIGATGLHLDQFTRVLEQGYEDAGKDLGIKVLIANSEFSLEKETEMINNFMEAGMMGLVIEPVSPESSVAIAEAVSARGIPVFACAVHLVSDIPFASSINNNYDLGKATGIPTVDWLNDKFGEGTEIKLALLPFDSTNPEASGQRIDGFVDQLKDLNINYVARQDAITVDEGFQRTTDIITANPDVQVIYAACEVSMIGAVNAIKSAGKAGEIYVFGIDVSVQLCDMMKDPDDILQIATAQAPYEQGVYAVNTMYNYLKDGTMPAEIHRKMDGITLIRGDIAAIDKFASDWAARSGG